VTAFFVAYQQVNDKLIPPKKLRKSTEKYI
jgi:hypothetical protein